LAFEHRHLFDVVSSKFHVGTRKINGYNDCIWAQEAVEIPPAVFGIFLPLYHFPHHTGFLQACAHLFSVYGGGCPAARWLEGVKTLHEPALTLPSLGNPWIRSGTANRGQTLQESLPQAFAFEIKTNFPPTFKAMPGGTCPFNRLDEAFFGMLFFQPLKPMLHMGPGLGSWPAKPVHLILF
jgi:hypothetical protein